MAASRRKNPPRRSLETEKFSDFTILRFYDFSLARVILLSREKEHQRGDEVGLMEFGLVFPCVGVNKDTSQRV